MFWNQQGVPRTLHPGNIIDYRHSEPGANFGVVSGYIVNSGHLCCDLSFMDRHNQQGSTSFDEVLPTDLPLSLPYKYKSVYTTYTDSVQILRKDILVNRQWVNARKSRYKSTEWHRKFPWPQNVPRPLSRWTRDVSNTRRRLSEEIPLEHPKIKV